MRRVRNQSLYQELVANSGAIEQLRREALGVPMPHQPRTCGEDEDRCGCQDSQHAAEGNSLEEAYECPICMEEIAEADAAMRCAGTGGVRHYVHAHCMTKWVETCQGRWVDATCPVCRGRVEIHQQRLDDFLNGMAASQLPAEDRNMLAGIAQGLVEKGWSMPTKEQVVRNAGIVTGAGWGFYSGYRWRSPSLGEEILWESSSNATRVVTLGAWVAGAAVRALQEWRKGSRAEEDDGDDV